MFPYTYTLSDFPQGDLNAERLLVEIRESASIVSALDGIDTEGSNVTITFKRELEPGEITALDALIASHQPTPVEPPPQLVQLAGLKATADNKLLVSVWPTDGSRVNLISPNWCDPTTWYATSERIEDETLTFDGEGIAQLAHYPVIDLTHGKIFGEDFLDQEFGRPLRLTLKKNGTPMTEQDPDGAPGDFTVNHMTGVITLVEAPDAGATYTISYNYMVDSRWYIVPDEGRLLRLKEVEVQFSLDASLRDTVQFQAQGQVQYFAPHLTALGFPADAYIPLGNAVRYKKMKDFLDEANGAFPIAPKTRNANPTWRDLTEDVITFPWNYQATINLISSKKMRIEVRLMNDRPISGQYATATFYALSEVEE